MIPSRPSRLLKSWFSRVIASRFQATFHELRVSGLEGLGPVLASHPVVFVSNHTSYWDPMFLILLSTRLCPFDGYAMMEARNLRRLPFLGRLGGFGVDLDDAADRAEAVRYAVEQLTGPGRAVWIFPQGRERPASERPLGFRPGAAVVATRAKDVRVVPVAFRYEFGSREKPFAYVSIGEAWEPGADVESERTTQEQAVGAELDRIEQSLSGPRPGTGFQVALGSRPSRLGRLMERMLGWITRYR